MPPAQRSPSLTAVAKPPVTPPPVPKLGVVKFSSSVARALSNGTAELVPDDDPHARLRELPQLNSFGVRTFGTNLLTIRVDLTD